MTSTEFEPPIPATAAADLQLRQHERKQINERPHLHPTMTSRTEVK